MPKVVVIIAETKWIRTWTIIPWNIPSRTKPSYIFMVEIWQDAIKNSPVMHMVPKATLLSQDLEGTDPKQEYTKVRAQILPRFGHLDRAVEVGALPVKPIHTKTNGKF